MKVLLTGGSGILGTDIKKRLEEASHEVLSFNSKNIAIENYADVKKKVVDFRPEIVIHSAAMTNVDLCESDKKSAVLINVIGSKNLSVAADLIGAKIIYISSCGVYGNAKSTPYTEMDQTVPVNYHHFTKLEGEKAVKEHNNRFLIIRPGWLFGGTTLHKKNFVEARRKEALDSTLLKSAGDKIGSPTYTSDLAKQVLLMIESDMSGLFNIVNQGCASRFEYVREIMKILRANITVESVDSSLFPRKANMPDNECLENFNLQLCGIDRMRDWKDALKEYINSTYLL